MQTSEPPVGAEVGAAVGAEVGATVGAKVGAAVNLHKLLPRGPASVGWGRNGPQALLPMNGRWLSGEKGWGPWLW